ncbi:acetoin reductase family protein [Epithele typhae]|uniref:acetoin reductase family protein n=1 Tax=Epithele typhae TaxID=378194 RepID=UPI002007D965|nr:acetoin reductase family protein [Epithele typhae]KAH9919210.1 acetoin reductase family protein [Epithele typhae]
MSLPRRVAIITGAAEGIGRAVARRLARDGYDLGLFDLPRAAPRLADLADTVQREHGAKVTLVQGDVTREKDERGGLYAMIANAGVAVNMPLHETPTSELDRMLDHAVRQMLAQGTGGRLVGAASHAAYCAGKFGVRALTQCAAMDYGKHGITANAYAPGAIETALLDNLDAYHTAKSGEKRGSWARWVRREARGVGGGRANWDVRDVAKLVSWLVSDEAAFVTVIVDGGMVFD